MKTSSVAIFLLLLAAPSVVFAHPRELSGTVTYVVDGDTFDVRAFNGTTYRVRMADVDANETYETGYAEAKIALNAMVAGKTIYLDVDDLYIWENHGTGDRVIAVPYLIHNSTHFLNVNEDMFLSSHVRKFDYQNEFNPYTWKLYEPTDNIIPEFPKFLVVLLVMVAFLAGALILARKCLKTRK